MAKTVRARELFGDHWMNGEPVSINTLRGSVVLLEFWEFTSVPCIHDVSYVNEWQERCGDLGFQAIGVHSPQYAFAKKPEQVESEIKRLQIRYPVVLDNQANLWSGYGARERPSRFVVDMDGFLRFVHRLGRRLDGMDAIIEKGRSARGDKRSCPSARHVSPDVLSSDDATAVGPGSISVAITLGANETQHYGDHIPIILAALTATALIAVRIFLCCAFANRLAQMLGETATTVITRLSSFLLLCIGVQIVWNGVSALLSSVPLHIQK